MKVSPNERSHPVSIFIAGDPGHAKRICREHCDQVGLCVTVTPTTYVYTGGEELGVIVGLINYPRFPSSSADIWQRAEALALHLRVRSFTLQAPDKTVWYSWRAEDCDSDGTATAALCEDIAVPKDCQARVRKDIAHTISGTKGRTA
jgi:hypothetical protein